MDTAREVGVLFSEDSRTEAQKAEDLAYSFPDVPCGRRALGTRVIVQMRRIKKKSSGGIILVEETKDTEKWNTQIAKVIQIGPMAFRNRETGEAWPEGAWIKEGMFVSCPRWGGNRWYKKVPGDLPEEEPTCFVTFDDHNFIEEVLDDPLSVQAYIL